MPAYNFKEAFSNDVEALIKRQTIRAKRKRPTGRGDDLYLYTGMRTKKCRLLLRTVCKRTEDVKICVGGFDFSGRVMMTGSPKADAFATADGFEDSEKMIEWFAATYKALPFKGEVIYW